MFNCTVCAFVYMSEGCQVSPDGDTIVGEWSFTRFKLTSVLTKRRLNDSYAISLPTLFNSQVYTMKVKKKSVLGH